MILCEVSGTSTLRPGSPTSRGLFLLFISRQCEDVQNSDLCDGGTEAKLSVYHLRALVDNKSAGCSTRYAKCS